MHVTEGLREVLEELGRARGKFPPFNSAHEGLAVLHEEFLELQNEVYWGKSRGHSIEQQRVEAIQVAAMALRFLDDVIDNPPE